MPAYTEEDQEFIRTTEEDMVYETYDCGACRGEGYRPFRVWADMDGNPHVQHGSDCGNCRGEGTIRYPRKIGFEVQWDDPITMVNPNAIKKLQLTDEDG